MDRQDRSMCLTIDVVLKLLAAGAFLGALPGAALANIGTGWLKKKLGVTTPQVRAADNAGDGGAGVDPDQSGADDQDDSPEDADK